MSNPSLRPQNFDEFKGQNYVKENLQVYINSSIKSKHQLDHILLYGLAGTGKTSLAFIIANLFNRELKVIQGTQIKKVSDLINFLSLICDGDILFIDEIHAIGYECFETLYSVLEDRVIDIRIGKEHNSKFMRIEMPNFTLIGATTDISKIPKPLEERFGINFFLDSYSQKDMCEIILQTALKLKINLTANEIDTIASYSKGIPRIANNLIKRIFDYKNTNAIWTIQEILTKMGLFNFGLNKLDLKYLKILRNNILGIKTISNLLEIDQFTIENKIEPYLIKNNLIIKTPKGRKITQYGENELEKIIKEGEINGI